MEVSESIENLWRKHCESFEGAIIMSKSSFVIAINELSQSQSDLVSKEKIIELIELFSGEIDEDADRQQFGSDHTQGKNHAYRIAICKLRKFLPQPPQV